MPRPPRSTPKTMHQAGELRRNTTPAEQKLWAALRNDQLGVNFRRQHALGSYIVDFVCLQKKLIIELDGGQHLEQEQYDNERTAFLQSKNYRVLRFWNHEILTDLDGVMGTIFEAIGNGVR